MIRNEAVYKVLWDYFNGFKDEGVLTDRDFREVDCQYLAGRVMAAIDRIELEEAAEHVNDFLETFERRDK